MTIENFQKTKQKFSIKDDDQEETDEQDSPRKKEYLKL